MNVEQPLQARNLTRVYRGTFFWRRVPALDRFGLSISPGMIVGLVGPNGSGKTTAIRCCLGLLRPTAGQTLLFGVDAGARPATPGRNKLGYVPESFGLCGRRTGRETLLLLGALSGIGRRELSRRIFTLSERFEISYAQDRLIAAYSKGMLRRLSIVAALLDDPLLLVLDEPFDGLDPLGSRIVRDELKRRAASGTAVLLSSHALAELEAVATHLTVLASGRILEQGPIDQVLARRDQIALVVKGLAPEALTGLERHLHEQGAELLKSAPARESLEDLFRRTIGGGDP